MPLSELINRFVSGTHICIYLYSHDRILWDGYADNYTEANMLSDERYVVFCVEATALDSVLISVSDITED